MVVGEAQFDAALLALEKFLHGVHADAAPRDFSHLVGGGKTGAEDALCDVFIGGLLVRANPAALHRDAANALERQAAAVVAQRDLQHALIHTHFDVDRACRRLAARDAFVCGLDAVVDRVAQQVHEHVLQDAASLGANAVAVVVDAHGHGFLAQLLRQRRQRLQCARQQRVQRLAAEQAQQLIDGIAHRHEFIQTARVG